VKRADAQKIVDDLIDASIKDVLVGLFTEIRDRDLRSVEFDEVKTIENYQARIESRIQAHGVVTDFINKNFEV
jgi:hypothetical protein